MALPTDIPRSSYFHLDVVYDDNHHLAGLATELLQEIQAFLPYSSQIALRFTCRSLHSKTYKPDLKYSMSDLLAIEKWPRYNDAAQREQNVKQPIAGLDFFACFLCRRIRSACHFGNAMMKGKRGKASTDKAKCGRFCTTCGAKTGLYYKGMSFAYGGAPTTGEAVYRGIVCNYCGYFHSAYGLCPNAYVQTESQLLDEENQTA